MQREKIKANEVDEDDIRPCRLWLVDGTFIDFKNRYYAHRDGYLLAPIIRYQIKDASKCNVVNIYEVARRVINKVGVDRLDDVLSLDCTIRDKYNMLDIADVWCYNSFRHLIGYGWTKDTPIESYYKIKTKCPDNAFTNVTHSDVEQGNIHRRYSMARMIYYSFNEMDPKTVDMALYRKDTSLQFSLDNLKFGRRVNVDATFNKCKLGWMSGNNEVPEGYDEAQYTQII